MKPSIRPHRVRPRPHGTTIPSLGPIRTGSSKNPRLPSRARRHAVGFPRRVSGGHSATVEPAGDSGARARRRVAGSRRVGNRLAHSTRWPGTPSHPWVSAPTKPSRLGAWKSPVHGVDQRCISPWCAHLSVNPEGSDVTWDSYRADDGRWVVTAYHAHQGVGTWYYEAVGRTVHPADASARALMGGGPTEVADDPTATHGRVGISAPRTRPRDTSGRRCRFR